ncbi:retrovirus-related pol polyprotein from transposon TNT 1-94 [Tanacetum coccineum]
MDLFGPSAVRSYGGNRYTLVIVDDYSMYTWTRFLKDKTEAFDQFEIFSKKIQNQLGCTIVSIRTDHGREFDNEVQFGEFCDANGITHNFSAPRTPQSNGVVERKNKTLQEMSKTMKIEESLNVTFDETPPPAKTSPLVDDDLDEEEAIREIEKKNLENNVKDETLEIDELVNIKESRNHSLENGYHTKAHVCSPTSGHSKNYEWSSRDVHTNIYFHLQMISLLLSRRQEGPVTRVRHKKEIDVIEYQVLTREIDPTFKDIETILRENVFGLGGNRDHVPLVYAS